MPCRAVLVSGTQLAGSAFQQKNALIGGSMAASVSASPMRIMFTMRGLRPARRSVRCNLRMSILRISPPVDMQTPPGPAIAPVIAGRSLIARVIMPPLSWRWMPQFTRMKDFFVPAYIKASFSTSAAGMPVMASTRSRG